MRLMDSYQMPPGQCSGCGGIQTPVIDLERTVDNGQIDLTIYLCHMCVKSMAHEFGFVPAEKHEVERAKLADARAGLRAAGEQILALEADVAEKDKTIETATQLGLLARKRAPRKVAA